MTKPQYKSQTIRNAYASFGLLLITTIVSMYDFEERGFRPPNQAEVATILIGLKTLQGTVQGRIKATEPIGKPNDFLTNDELIEMAPLDVPPNFEYISQLESAEEVEVPQEDDLDSVDFEEEDNLDMDFSKLQGKYALKAKQDSKLKTSVDQSESLKNSDWIDVDKDYQVEIDSWKFLKEQNSHIQVGIDEYSNINSGQFYVYAPHFDLISVTGSKVEIDTPSSPVKIISKNKTAIKLPGYQSTFYLEDPIYPGSSFTWREATKNGSRMPNTKQIVDNIILQARNLDKLREFNGDKPLVVTSWYRDPRTNSAVGGATRSDHLTGRSTDLLCPSMSIWEFQKVVLSFWKFGGVGKGANKGFCHVSSDGSYRVWDY